MVKGGNFVDVMCITSRDVIWVFGHYADSLSPGDVGLEGEAQDDEDRGYGVFGVSPVTRVRRWAQPITFLDIHECDTFTISVGDKVQKGQVVCIIEAMKLMNEIEV
ncbi:unnamed protein product [Brassica napus]|uniref:Biotin carboxyl carrier protein of acetyl-CoA carboxylase n=1 Tax=Brassica napus TaxID=3708 RepID=A0A816QV15_BRANA|nr:unnamed protein product [Brassica napus]